MIFYGQHRKCADLLHSYKRVSGLSEMDGPFCHFHKDSHKTAYRDILVRKRMWRDFLCGVF